MSPHPVRTHVFIIDGTMSRLHEGHETNAGLLFKLLREVGPLEDQTFAYDPGVQGMGARKWVTVAAGVGINRSIEHGYAVLASRYEPGDRIMLFGYSRGAYAARSLAGFISNIGLLKRSHATHRRVVRAFRYYEADYPTEHSRQFSYKFCHERVPIEMVGVWDTVGALGLPYPILTRLAPMATEFHNHKLGQNIRHAFHALALDETRTAYDPIMWTPGPRWNGVLEQMWFAGAHADIGGHVRRFEKARPLSNIPFRWMLEKAEMCGLRLPQDWPARFPTDPLAPMVGDRRDVGRMFILRRPREVGETPDHMIHPSVAYRQAHDARYRPKAIVGESVEAVAV
jgi:uncharacterized protein (DUF2235 family)